MSNEQNIREPPIYVSLYAGFYAHFLSLRNERIDFRSPPGTAHLAEKVLVPFAGREGVSYGIERPRCDNDEICNTVVSHIWIKGEN
jgi:hypothetical protein